MRKLLSGLAERDDDCVVFLLLGGFARKLFNASGVEAASKAAGRWGVSVSKVENAHPGANAVAYFLRPNPLMRVNAALVDMGASQVIW